MQWPQWLQLFVVEKIAPATFLITAAARSTTGSWQPDIPVHAGGVILSRFHCSFSARRVDEYHIMVVRPPALPSSKLPSAH